MMEIENMAENKKGDPRRCITPLARISFPKVYKAEAFQDGEPKYSCSFLFEKTANLGALKKAVQAAKVKKWGADESSWPKGVRSPFNDGDDKADLDGYAGTIYVNASNKHRPDVVDRKLEPLTEDSGDFYAGCYGIAALCAFAYGGKGTPYKPGVSFSLESIQKQKDGEPFSGKKRAADVFEAMEDDEEQDEESDDNESGGW